MNPPKRPATAKRLSGSKRPDVCPTGTVLLIEDHLVSRTLLVNLLALHGIIVKPVGSLAEGVRRFKRNKFDCVIVDLELPDSDGEHTLAQLPGLFDPAPVLVLTGHATEAIVQRCVEQKMRLLLKGSSADELIKSILLDIQSQHPDTNCAAKELIEARSSTREISLESLVFNPLSMDAQFASLHSNLKSYQEEMARRLTLQDASLEAIKIQTTATNGRVNLLEDEIKKMKSDKKISHAYVAGVAAAVSAAVAIGTVLVKIIPFH